MENEIYFVVVIVYNRNVLSPADSPLLPYYHTNHLHHLLSSLRLPNKRRLHLTGLLPMFRQLPVQLLLCRHIRTFRV